MSFLSETSEPRVLRGVPRTVQVSPLLANAGAAPRTTTGAGAPRPRALAAGLALAFAAATAGQAGAYAPLAPPAAGGWITVGNCDDSGPGSLREAMTFAMDGDFVDAQALACGTITLTTGQIHVAANEVTLAGRGAGALTITNGGGNKYDGRIFSHSGTGIFAVVGVTLRDGAAAGSAQAPDALGGCIRSNGTVVLSNGVVKNCSARAS